MAQFEPMSTMRRAVLPRLGRVATSAAIALALGCGVAPLASTVAPAFAWAEEAAQAEGVNKAPGLAADAANTSDEPVAAARATVPEPRGKWTFDGEDPKTNAISGSNLTLTFTGDAIAQDSNVKALGKIVRFDSKDKDYDVKVSRAINNQGDYSISLWLKPDKSMAKTNVLQLSGVGKTILYQLEDGHYGTYIKGEDHTFARQNPGHGSWHHVLFVKSGMSVTLYINGTIAGTTTWTDPLAEGPTLDLIIGEHKDQANSDVSRYQGNMDELQIFGSALTAEQAQTLYAGYKNVSDELAVQVPREQLAELAAKGESMLDNGTGAAYDELRAAVEEAKALANSTDVNAINEAKAKLEKAIGAVYALGVTVRVDPEAEELRTIDKGLFGINHRYAFNGYGSYDSKEQAVRKEFADLYSEANFGSVRYPGGTISNLFNWKETIGDQEKRVNQIHGFYNTTNRDRPQGGIRPNFGLMEMGNFAEQQGSEMIYVYSLGRGDADDAADLIEFLNAEVGDNPNGGVDWAKVRADYHHPKPYNVRYFEIGNEMQLGGADGVGSQQYWTTTVLSNPDGSSTAKKAPVDGYISGGMVDRVQEYAVVKGDWHKQRSISTGEPDQVFGMRYALTPREGENGEMRDVIIPDSVVVRTYTVQANGEDERNGEQWKRVQNFNNSGPDSKHYVLDPKTGTITFGDGKQGDIPDEGKRVKVSYKVERDGFVEISKSMHKTMDAINAKRAARGESAGELHVYSSFEASSFINNMNAGNYNEWYDGIVIHPYSRGPVDGSGIVEENFYLKSFELGNKAVKLVSDLTHEMREVTKDETKVPVISEYGIYNSTNVLVRSQMHALYIADQIMEYIRLGAPYIQKHCLVDWYTKGADTLGPTQQAVIQAVPGDNAELTTGEGQYRFFKTPSALTFELYNGTDDNPGFGTHILPSTLLNTGTLSNGVDLSDALVSKDDAGNLYFAMTNLDLTKKNTATLAVDGIDLTGRDIEIRSFSGEAYNTENDIDNPDKVAITTKMEKATEAAPTVELDPHSFTIVKVLAEQPPARHTVTFKVDDKVWDTKTVTEGSLVPAPAEPSKDGFRFTGWTLDGAPFDILKTPITGSITLVAAFEKVEAPAPDPVAEHTVTFMADGKVHHTAVVKDGELVTPPANPVKDGHTFKGWLLDGKSFDFNAPVTGDLTLEASFAKDASEPGKPAEPSKPGNSGTKPGGSLPSTGDPAVIAAALALAGSGAALAGSHLRRRR